MHNKQQHNCFHTQSHSFTHKRYRQKLSPLENLRAAHAWHELIYSSIEGRNGGIHGIFNGVIITCKKVCTCDRCFFKENNKFWTPSAKEVNCNLYTPSFVGVKGMLGAGFSIFDEMQLCSSCQYYYYYYYY